MKGATMSRPLQRRILNLSRRIVAKNSLTRGINGTRWFLHFQSRGFPDDKALAYQPNYLATLSAGSDAWIEFLALFGRLGRSEPRSDHRRQCQNARPHCLVRRPP